MNWKQCSFFLVLVFCACKGKEDLNGQEIEKAVLQSYALAKDTMDLAIIIEVVKELNCLSREETGRTLALARNYNAADSAQILVIPFRSILGDLSSCAYSSIKDRFILLNPALVRDFNHRNTINDTTSLPAIHSLILLHELGHFVLGREGAFDRIEKEGSKLGEQKINTEPEYMTVYKRTELSADSLGASWIKKHVFNIKNMDCFGIASTVQTVLPGIQFQLFGMRLLDNFGSPVHNLLRDPSQTHPNLELRIAFMNYYLTGLADQKQMIDEYLYEREVAPIHRQQTDPRIFQDMEKILPEKQKK